MSDSCLLGKARAAVKLVIPSKYRQHWRVTLFRRWLNWTFFLKKKLTGQLKHQSTCQSFPNGTGLRILVAAIETSHYNFFHHLILAKALQIRGASVRVLVCGEYIDGCEIKSVRNENTSDPCWSCRFSVRNIVGLFGLEVVSLPDYITEASTLR